MQSIKEIELIQYFTKISITIVKYEVKSTLAPVKIIPGEAYLGP